MTTSPTGRYTLYPSRYQRSMRAKTLAHLVPAVVLVSGLLPLLAGREALTPLLALEVLVGLAYLVLMRRELRHLRHPAPHHEPVAWLELAVAGILGLEGYHLWHRHHAHNMATGNDTFHMLPWLYGALALVFVGLAFGLARLLERRFLHLHPGGFAGRLGHLQAPFSYSWDDIRAVEPAGADALLVHLKTGRAPQRLVFTALHDGDAHRDRLLTHIQAGLGTASAEELA